jgi:protein O-mannosyl-transferase
MTSRQKTIWLVALAALAVYFNSLWNGFAYDDVWIIANNPRIHDPTNLRGLLLTPYWPNYGPEYGLYRPLTIFGFAMQWFLVGDTPSFFHFINVLAHTGCAVLVFLLVEQLISRRAALAAALLFAVHPLHTEAVANVVGQAELWATLTALAACVIYAKRPATRIGPERLVAIVVLYATGMLAKESAVVLPALLLLIDVVQQRIQPNRESIIKYIDAAAFTFIMLAAVLFAYITLRVSVLGNFGGVNAAPDLPFLRQGHRVLNALRSWPEYVRLLFFPFNLSIDYGPGVVLPVESFTPMTLLGLLFLVVTITLMLATPWHRYSGLVAGWFMIAILPVSNLLIPIGVLIAERTLYLPSVAVCILAGIIWEHASAAEQRETRRLALALAIALVLVFSVKTISRNRTWDSLLTVWQSLQRDHPESYRSAWIDAGSRWVSNDLAGAERSFLFATHMWPHDSQLLGDIGNFYISQRRYHDAAIFLERSRRMTPWVVRTSELLAYAYLYDNRPADALRSALFSLSSGMSQRSLMYAVLAGSYERLGKWDQAAGAWRAATRTRSGGTWLHWAMQARALARAGHDDAARAAARAARARTKDPKLLALLDKLDSAIETKCYGGNSDCDPLAGWVIAVGQAPTMANSNTAAKGNTAAAGATSLVPGKQ